MPCKYDVSIKDNLLREDLIILDSWVDEVWDGIVDEGQVFAYAHDSQGKIRLLTNGKAYLSTKSATIGQEIGPEDRIAVFACEGEDVPYLKPSCIVEYE